MAQEIGIGINAINELSKLERDVYIWLNQDDQKQGTPVERISRIFKPLSIEKNDKTIYKYTIKNINGKFELIDAYSDYKKTIWSHIYDYLDRKLKKILENNEEDLSNLDRKIKRTLENNEEDLSNKENYRCYFEQFVCRLPFENKYGTFTIAGNQFNDEKREGFIKKLNQEDFLFLSSIFLLHPKNINEQEINKDECMQNVCACLTTKKGPIINALKDFKEICVIVYNDFSNDIEFIRKDDSLRYGKYKEFFINNFIAYKNWIQCDDNDDYCIFFIPSGFDSLSRTALLCPVLLKSSISEDEIRTIFLKLWVLSRTVGDFCEKYLNQLIEDKEKQEILLAYTQSAIGSIMSRNGSHNIGSHVLAALSHNIGTMPDDRILYQYIQHRMDYIATATTEFPMWATPTMFLSNIMKTFLSQRHLLDNIAGSEDLKAWKFQGRSIDVESISVAKLKFHIRKRKNNVFQKVLTYDNQNGGVNLDEDFALAIPGGMVGQHAFFTIIENVIRNAAKHDWSSPPKKIKEKGIKKLDNEGKVSQGNLEIFIDFEDLRAENNVEFTIFSNMSDADEILDDKNNTTVFDKVAHAIKEPFIDERGNLRRKNWGIAEMKIAAGYLQSREPGVIGGLASSSEKAIIDEKRFGEVLTAVKVSINENDDIKHLGYQFKISKPRTLLIIVDKIPEELNENRKQELNKFGINIQTKEQAGKINAYNSYEFIIIDSIQEEQLTWSLPFRIICMSKNNISQVKNIVAIWDNNNGTPESLVNKLSGCKTFALESEVDDILSQVSACWIQYLKNRQELDSDFNLIINAADTNEKSSGQSLINEASAVAYVFQEGFQKAINGFQTLYKKEYSKIKQVLDYLEKLNADVDQYVAISDASCRNLIKQQLSNWLKNCPADNVSDIIAFFDAKEERDCPMKKFVDYLEQVCRQAKGYLGKYAETIVTLPKFEKFSKDKEDLDGWVDSHKDIKTNPKLYFKSNPCDNVPAIKYIRHYNSTEAIARTEEEIKKHEPPAFVTNPFRRLGQGSNILYIEPLSGTQSYFSQIQSLIKKKNRLFKTKLVESALMRILIIDERVSKFIDNHSDATLATLARMGIFIADDKMVTKALEAESDEEKENYKYDIDATPSTKENPVTYTEEGLVKLDVEEIKLLRNRIKAGKSAQISESYDSYKKHFDVLIVHQGILDKWYKGIVEDDDKNTALYNSFKEIFSYVIITTGRGTPATIPNMARVLPFSTIETTLFRKYPEKLILVDAIMNILPHRK